MLTKVKGVNILIPSDMTLGMSKLKLGDEFPLAERIIYKEINIYIPESILPSEDEYQGPFFVGIDRLHASSLDEARAVINLFFENGDHDDDS